METVGRRTESPQAGADNARHAAAMAVGDGARKRRRNVGLAFTVGAPLSNDRLAERARVGAVSA
jgi:hypothetical protein